MRRSAIGALALVITVPAGAVSVAAPATAATVSVSSIGGFVADDVHQRVFVGDQRAGTIQAADYSGNLVDAASGVYGVTDLALSADHEILYAVSSSTHDIVALDADTLDEITRYTVPTIDGPRHLAFAGGKIWFSYGDQHDGNLGSVSPSTGVVTMNQYPDRIWNPALLDVSATEPGLLGVGQTGISTDSMAVLDVSGAAPAEVAYHDGDYTLNNGIDDFDLIPGAPQVLVNGRERQSYAEGRFSAAGAYPEGYRADVSRTGLVASARDYKVHIYRPNVSRPINVIEMNAAALVWAGDESRLFALRGNGPFELNVIRTPSVNKPKLTASAPASAPRGRELAVSGTLTSVVPAASSISLDVLRKDIEHPDGTALPKVPVGPDGTWSFKDTPTTGGRVTYVVSYPGDDHRETATSSATVSVSRTTPALTLRPARGTHAYGTKVTFTAHLGSTHSNRNLELWVDPAGADEPRTLVRRGAVNAQGDRSWTVTLRRNSVVSAVYTGDARTDSRTVSVTASARVAIKTAVTRQYKTAKIGARKYRWFHRRTTPVVKTTMSRYPGRAARTDVQVLVNGSWRSASSRYARLDSAGRVSVKIARPGQGRNKVRVRSSYVRRSSGDSANATTRGAWTYLYWTK